MRRNDHEPITVFEKRQEQHVPLPSSLPAFFSATARPSTASSPVCQFQSKCDRESQAQLPAGRERYARLSMRKEGCYTSLLCSPQLFVFVLFWYLLIDSLL